jgi:hypothetical protein
VLVNVVLAVDGTVVVAVSLVLAVAVPAVPFDLFLDQMKQKHYKSEETEAVPAVPAELFLDEMEPKHYNLRKLKLCQLCRPCRLTCFWIK